MGALRVWATCALIFLSACGGSGSEQTLPTTTNQPTDTAVGSPSATTESPQTVSTVDNADSQITAVVSVGAKETATETTAYTLLLLLPDDSDVTDPFITTWLDAAAEEGLQMSLMFDSQFIALGSAARRYAGLMLPDVVHQAASDELVQAVREYVNAGGKLMLTFDAAILAQDWFYPLQDPARLSDLAGVGYVYYNEFYAGLIPTIWGAGPVLGADATLRKLQVPPGKSMPYPSVNALVDTTARNDVASKSALSDLVPIATPTLAKLAAVQRARRSAKPSASTASSKSRTSTSASNALFGTNATPLAVTADQAISTYVYGYADYASYLTRGIYDGEVLLSSPELGLVAGVRHAGQGQVLFVNLPLAFFKNYGTDAMLLNGFLHYFAVDMLHLPRLSPQPNGRGGLVLNWHLDSAAALNPIAQLDQLGVWTRGRFSIHMTAGPDAIVPSDGLGLNLLSNTTAQNWLRKFVSQGHEVGSHGGWVHDYFGLNASETNADEFLPYLILNKGAIEQVTGKSVIEYSAPVGNNPSWALDWLESNGVVGYYTTAHTGTALTHSYENGVLRNQGLWAFPVTPFGRYATFEEFYRAGISSADVSTWFTNLLAFVATHHTNRLIYLHPPGAMLYPQVMSQLFDNADALISSGVFRWYTMTDLARFNSTRRGVSWTVQELSETEFEFTASHPSDLAEQTWLLPKAGYAEPVVSSGRAHVAEDANNWLVVADGGQDLTFTATTR